MQDNYSNRSSEDAAPSVGTLHYSEGGVGTVPQNLGGLSRRRGQISDKLVRGWRVLLRPSGDKSSGLSEVAAGETVTPVGTISSPADPLGVLKFQPVLYAHADLQEYRARRRREEEIGKAMMGILALAVTVSVGIVLFVHPAKKDTTLTQADLRGAAAPVAAPIPAAPPITPYKVKEGDTLSGIAQRHGIKLKALLAANSMTDRTTLKIGKKLIIPAKAAANPQATMLPVVAAMQESAADQRLARPLPQSARAADAAAKPVAAALAASEGVAKAGEGRFARQEAPKLPQKYSVRRGDFPERVAKRFGLHPDTVLAANGLNSRSILQVGGELKIPPADGYYHRVRRGESLPKLLKKHDVSEAKFRRFNPEVGDILRAKQVVFIPGKPPEVAEPKAEKRRAKRDRAANAAESRQTREGRGYRERDERKRGSRSFFGDIGRAIADGFHWPSPSREISSGFGDRRRDFHAGLDIRAKRGTPIRAARDGVVVHSGWEGGYGRMVEIDHGAGVRTRYAHASSLKVSVGERVSAGDLIARVGSSGHSTGPHLHYEVRVNGRAVNPEKVH